MFVDLFLLAFLSLDVVRNIAKGFCYESGNCIVEDSVITGHNVSGKCGMHSCFSHYPCLTVMVSRDNRQDKEKTAVQVCSFQIIYQSIFILLHNNIFDLRSHVRHVYVYCIKRN